MRHLFTLAMLGLLAAGCAAEARGLAEVTITDRDHGTVLNPYWYHGEYWVAGTPGARYSIGIRNQLGERLLAVTSVDGVNVISGETAAWDQTGYVFAANESYQIAGWRKSDAEVAAFNFTSASNSYAGRTGRSANVGVIGVALFREQRPVPAFDAAAPAAGADSAVQSEQLGAGRAKLGTGHGPREYSYVNHTEFERMSPEPNEIIRIHYDSLENLIAMGIVKPRSAPTPPNPFPGSHAPRYAADPPG